MPERFTFPEWIQPGCHCEQSHHVNPHYDLTDMYSRNRNDSGKEMKALWMVKNTAFIASKIKINKANMNFFSGFSKPIFMNCCGGKGKRD